MSHGGSRPRSSGLALLFEVGVPSLSCGAALGSLGFGSTCAYLSREGAQAIVAA